MNLSQLYYFKKLAELRHYTKASKELFITQPTLSDSISNLEKELGTALFRLEGRSVKLTKNGEDFYSYVCSALNELDKGVADIKERSSSLGGKIEIGCIPTLLSDFLPNAINGYMNEKNNSVKINIYTAYSMPIMEKIQNEEFDIGFCSPLEEKDKNLIFIPVLYQKYKIIVKKGHHLSGLKSIHPGDLAPYHLISYRHSTPIGKHLKTHLDNYKLNPSYLYDDEISIGGIISNSDSVGIVADTPYLRQFDNLVSIALEGIPHDAHPICLTYKNRKYTSKTIESFVNYIKNYKTRLEC